MVRSIFLSNGGVTLVDDTDYPAVCGLPWRRKANGYVSYRFTENGLRREIFLHRLIMQPRSGQVVDHINGDRLNNTRKNLRRCSHQENLRNRRCFKNNGCGFKGVTAWRGQWLARIYINDQALKLGVYDDLRSAALAYDFAAGILFQQFALVNLRDQPIPDEVRVRVMHILHHSRRPDVRALLNRLKVGP